MDASSGGERNQPLTQGRDRHVLAIFPAINCTECDSELPGKLFLSQVSSLAETPDERRKF
jgi:hypothetical protein